jgi:hypothetical protein
LGVFDDNFPAMGFGEDFNGKEVGLLKGGFPAKKVHEKWPLLRVGKGEIFLSGEGVGRAGFKNKG